MASLRDKCGISNLYGVGVTVVGWPGGIAIKLANSNKKYSQFFLIKFGYLGSDVPKKLFDQIKNFIEGGTISIV